MTRRASTAALLAIVLAAGAWRVAYVLVETQHQPLPAGLDDHGVRRAYDEHYYQQQAVDLAHGIAFREPALDGPSLGEGAGHPPLTVLVLTPVAAVFGDDALPMRLVMALVGTATVALAGVLGTRLGGGRRVGLVAAAFAAAYPNLWMNDGLVMSETLATFAVGLTLLASLQLRESGRAATAVLCGVAAAAAALARGEQALLVLAMVVPAALGGGGPGRKRWRNAAIALSAAAVTVLPWVAFNLARFEEPVFLSTADGAAIVGANCARTYDGPLLGLHDGFCGLADARAAGGARDASVVAAAQRARGVAYARGHADRLPAVVAARVGRAWSLFRPGQMARIGEAEGRPSLVSWLGAWSLYAALPLAVLGALALRRAGRPLWLVAAPLAVATANAALFFGWPRHRAPAELSVVLLAALGAVSPRRRPAPR